ncbi:MAG: DMT family transporter [Cardiobacteriaceae bacterium]|nr:DMT family transporter [Cardiobacteriaceae bacterium]
MSWLIFSLFAACMQACRNALQKQLSHTVPVLGVTLARFLYAVPIAVCYLASFYLRDPSLSLPSFNRAFVLYVFAAAMVQILATALMVQLFRLKNYAIGAGLARSEAILAAILGVLFFGTQLGLFGWLGIFIGTVAVFLLSGAGVRQLSLRVLVTGLSSGLCFALTSLWIRQAGLSLHIAPLHAAAWVLLSILTLQAMALLFWLLAYDRATLRKLLAQPRLAMATSTFSCLGSIGWFSAMCLQDVALVKTVGQIEVLFMLIISAVFFKERLKKQDLLGLLFIVIAALLVVWA